MTDGVYDNDIYAGPAEGEGLGESSAPHFFENYIELLRKVFSAPSL